MLKETQITNPFPMTQPKPTESSTQPPTTPTKARTHLEGVTNRPSSSTQPDTETTTKALSRWVEDTRKVREALLQSLLKTVVLNKYFRGVSMMYYPCCNSFTKHAVGNGSTHKDPIKNAVSLMISEPDDQAISDFYLKEVALLANESFSSSSSDLRRKTKQKVLDFLLGMEHAKLRSFIAQLPRHEGKIHIPLIKRTIPAHCESLGIEKSCEEGKFGEALETPPSAEKKASTKKGKDGDMSDLGVNPFESFASNGPEDNQGGSMKKLKVGARVLDFTQDGEKEQDSQPDFLLQNAPLGGNPFGKQPESQNQLFNLKSVPGPKETPQFAKIKFEEIYSLFTPRNSQDAPEKAPKREPEARQESSQNNDSEEVQGNPESSAELEKPQNTQKQPISELGDELPKLLKDLKNLAIEPLQDKPEQSNEHSRKRYQSKPIFSDDFQQNRR